MKTMKNTSKKSNMTSNTNMIILLVVALVIGAFIWKSAYKMSSLSQTEVVVADEIEGKNDLTEAANELDSVNVDGEIDPDLTKVYSEAQTMK
jgi:septal ring-binding cell division protein DamX